MSFGKIQVGTAEGVNVIRIVRPDKKNALTSEMYRALSDALEAGERNGSVAAHVLFGSEGVFTAGNDIGDFLSHDGGSGGRLEEVLRFLRLLPMLKKPIVAGVDGLAVGIGTTALFHCDLVYASPRSTFATPFVDLGLVPEAGSSLLAPRIMGYVRAFELLVLGEAFSAERMRESGLVNAIFEQEMVEEAALAAARRLAAKPAAALSLSRSLLKGDLTGLGERMETEIRIFDERIQAPEARAAFTAFLGKDAAGDTGD